MARPLRIQFPGALYHVTSRGDRSEDIFRFDDDRTSWLRILGEVCTRFNWKVHAFCQMTNHYHVVVETVDGNLSRGMRQLNGQYTQWFNWRHALVGHLFQGRFKAILVQRDTHLLELARYVVLNPVRAGIVRSADEWRWSSFAMMTGTLPTPAPAWLDTRWLLSQFASEHGDALAAYRAFVRAGRGASAALLKPRNQLLMGDEDFARQCGSGRDAVDAAETVRVQRQGLALTLDEYRQNYSAKNEAMARAYLSGAYTMAEVARHFQMHYKTVSRAVRVLESSKCPNVRPDPSGL